MMEDGRCKMEDVLKNKNPKSIPTVAGTKFETKNTHKYPYFKSKAEGIKPEVMRVEIINLII